MTLKNADFGRKALTLEGSFGLTHRFDRHRLTRHVRATTCSLHLNGFKARDNVGIFGSARFSKGIKGGESSQHSRRHRPT